MRRRALCAPVDLWVCDPPVVLLLTGHSLLQLLGGQEASQVSRFFGQVLAIQIDLLSLDPVRHPRRAKPDALPALGVHLASLGVGDSRGS